MRSVYFADPLVEPAAVNGMRWPIGTEATCRHCGERIFYSRPGDWYHRSSSLLECHQGRVHRQAAIQEVDPDLERLLAEEEEIERRLRIAAKTEEEELAMIQQEVPHTVASLQKMAKEFDHWASDEQYPVEDWQYEVRNGDTRLGYHDWLHKKRSGDA